jgi:endonuclease-3
LVGVHANRVDSAVAKLGDHPRYDRRVAGPRSIRGRAKIIVERLGVAYPGTAAELCALGHATPFQLLISTILSAQCTDERVNIVAPSVFAAYPEPEDLAGADAEALERLIYTTGFFRAKAKSLIGMANGLVARFDGEVPRDLDDLVTLPGVGRKTGNVIRSVAFGLPGLPVDTHVGRLARRLGLTTENDPVRVEHDLCALVAPQEWGSLSLRLILHGRAICGSRRPLCGECLLADICPSAGTFVTSAPKRAQTKTAEPKTTQPVVAEPTAPARVKSAVPRSGGRRAG